MVFLPQAGLARHGAAWLYLGSIGQFGGSVGSRSDADHVTVWPAPVSFCAAPGWWLGTAAPLGGRGGAARQLTDPKATSRRCTERAARRRMRKDVCRSRSPAQILASEELPHRGVATPAGRGPQGSDSGRSS